MFLEMLILFVSQYEHFVMILFDSVGIYYLIITQTQDFESLLHN